MSQTYFKFLLISFTCLTFTLSSCSKSDNEPEQETITGPLELPVLKGGDNNLFVSHFTTFRGEKVMTYSMEYSCLQKHARWVAFKFYNTTAEINAGRTDAWADDPEIPAQYRSTRTDFSGYDRGHICASYDRVYSKDANKQTFYYSNMSPQLHDFNTGIWVDLEQTVQNWGRNSSLRDTLYVVKGGTIDKPELIKTYATGPNKLPVPKYYYMALLCRKNNTYKAIAFWMEHKSYSQPYDIKKYAVSIDKLEELTGLDFFHNLPTKLENAVEANMDINNWPGL